jgi:capsular polysaccharide export protein
MYIFALSLFNFQLTTNEASLYSHNVFFFINSAQMHSHMQYGWARFAGKRVLLLQGPHGPFFQRVASVLIDAGALAVEKINFNGGDAFFYPEKAFAYNKGLSDWPAYLAAFIQKHAVDCIIVFGDCRPMHIEARTVAHAHGVQYWVFEEGYVRPNFITFELHGVNGFSCLPTEREAYDLWPVANLPQEAQVPASFKLAAKYAMAYFTAATLAKPWFWRYRHHRNLTMLDGWYWVRSYARKIRFQAKEAKLLGDLKPQGVGKFFLVVLQVAADAQVAMHSPYQSISEFIVDTVLSFARNAPKDAVLVIKHHPMDRGYSNYSKLIADLELRYHLTSRLRYIHDQHLPTLLENAEGVVTINSTVGLSALSHCTPVITMGKAVYDMQGLTCQVGLEAFWRNPQAYKPDPVLHEKFRNYVIVHTQINGNFYVELPQTDAAGLLWCTVPAPLLTADKPA